MHPQCDWRRAPRAGEPIVSAGDAIAVLDLAIGRPLRPETIAIPLDDGLRSDTIVVVSGTTPLDAVLVVCEMVAGAIAESRSGGGLVLASVRPGEPVTSGDLDRWLDASAVAGDLCVELVEWFVVSGSDDTPTYECPRDMLGERPRW